MNKRNDVAFLGEFVHRRDFQEWVNRMIAALECEEPEEDDAVMYVPHAGRPACGNTMIDGGQVKLFRLGLFLLKCKSCGENLLPLREDA